jgi:hypothetical protein
MSKIIRLDDKKESLVNYLKEILDMAEKGKIKKILTIAIDESENVDTMKKDIMIGFYDLDLNEKYYLLSHLQAELSYKLVETNVDKLIEIINE